MSRHAASSPDSHLIRDRTVIQAPIVPLMDATTPTPTRRLPPEIRGLLSGLRWRIRAYVWLEGLALGVVWLAATFWLALAMDYLPVLAGASEMPRAARAVMLAVIAAVLAWIFYRYIFRRAFVRLVDRSMALLLERRFAELGDRLITSVEMVPGDDTSSVNVQMLEDTEAAAVARLDRVHLRRVFNARPLLSSSLVAAALVGTLVAFYAARSEAFLTGARRIYALDEQPWPRQARIEVVGVSVPQAAGEGEEALQGPIQSFEQRRVKVARGAKVTLTVQADGGAAYVPEFCTIYYRTAEGDRGRVNMTRVGKIRDGYQTYTFDDKPLLGILADMQFDVIGYDHRVRGYEIEVVDAPIIVGAELDCEFPAYLVDEERALWLPRSEPLTAGSKMPFGTDVTIRARSNKPLREVHIRHSETGVETTIGPDELGDEAFEFVYQAGPLTGNLPLEVTLLDADGVTSERPHRLFVAAVEDQPPRIDVALKGIGTAVTPDVRIPLAGSVSDDYAVDATWLEVLVNDGTPQDLPLDVPAGGSLNADVDFRRLRDDERLTLAPTDQLHLTIKARDHFDLTSDRNVGAGDHYELDVVTPGELLTQLEARELALRQRFEQIIQELMQMRDSLVRVRNEGPEASLAAEPELAADSTEDTGPDAVPADDDAADGDAEKEARLAADEAEKRRLERLERLWSLRLLRSQRGILQCEKSAQEIQGVAASFDDIRAELINNRVDTEDRKERLKDKIADPLQAIVANQFPELNRRLEALVAQLNDRRAASLDDEDPETVELAEAAVAQTSEILLALEEVLQDMLDLESYNELLDLVRGLIEDQKQLLDEAKKQQKKQVLDLLN